MFKSTKELAIALAEGRKFTTSGGGVLWFDYESKRDPFRYTVDKKTEPMRDRWAMFDRVTEVKEWHENIPDQGILCWVWEDKPEDKIASIIVKYVPEKYPFSEINTGALWKNAEPISKEEALSLLYADS